MELLLILDNASIDFTPMDMMILHSMSPSDVLRNEH